MQINQSLADNFVSAAVRVVVCIQYFAFYFSYTQDLLFKIQMEVEISLRGTQGRF